MMDLQIETESLQAAAAELRTIQARVMTAAATAAQAGLSGAFSTAPALDMLGAAHGNVLAGVVGSAQQVLGALAEQVSWLHDGLLASSEALEKQNLAGSHALMIADKGGAVAPGMVAFPVRPALIPMSFPFPPPVAKPMPTVAALVAAFSGTNLGAVSAAASAWTSMATALGEVAVRLATVAGRVGAENRGDVITAGVSKILGVSRAARSFSTNAGVMAAQVAKLLGIHQIGLSKVMAAQSMLQAIPDPAVRTASEAAFLAAFPAELTPIAMTAVPSIRSLLNWAAFGGGGIATTGMDILKPSHFSGTADLSPQTMVGRVLDEVVPNRAEVQRIVSEMPKLGENAQAVTRALAATPTQTAAHQSSTVATAVGSQPVAGMSPSQPGGSGLSAAHQAMASGMPMMSGMSQGSSGQSLGSSSRMHPSGSLMTPGGVSGRDLAGVSCGISSRWAATQLASSSPDGAFPESRSGGVSFSRGRHSMAASNGVTLGSLGGALAGGLGGSRMHGGFSAGGAHGSPVSSGLGAAGGVGSAGATVPAVQSGAGVRMGGSPMGHASPVGMMGAMTPQQASRSKTKVKTVTSCVEENENIAALLGKRTPVVPGVIGAWVRN